MICRCNHGLLVAVGAEDTAGIVDRIGHVVPRFQIVPDVVHAHEKWFVLASSYCKQYLE